MCDIHLIAHIYLEKSVSFETEHSCLKIIIYYYLERNVTGQS